MLTLFFYGQIPLLLFVWALSFFSPHWSKKLPIKIILFFTPFFFGMMTLTIIFSLFPLPIIREYQFPIYLYSTFNLLFLIPHWYKLMWEILQMIPHRNPTETQKLSLAIAFALFMVTAIIFIFALYYLWIDSISGIYQGLKSAISYYQPIDLDLPTAFYFSFVTYFTLGYGDLIPYGPWMQLMVFSECLLSLLNTGVIIIYIYNYLFAQSSDSNHPYK